MISDPVRKVLKKLQRGEVTVDAVAKQLASLNPSQTAVTTDARVDVDRFRRCGYPEVVYCEGKSIESIIEIFEAITRQNQDYFGTRVSSEQARGLTERFPEARYNPVARTVRSPQSDSAPTAGRVAVITAGTSDRPVAEEAVETLHWMRCGVELLADVGVAGPHRLTENHHRFDNSDAIVVVAGMEGALPSVVGGYVSCPVIAVPTSIGYGANFGGLAALLGMLNSCAANVTVVNIDAGFKGGYVAGLIARRIASAKEPI